MFLIQKIIKLYTFIQFITHKFVKNIILLCKFKNIFIITTNLK